MSPFWIGVCVGFVAGAGVSFVIALRMFLKAVPRGLNL